VESFFAKCFLQKHLADNGRKFSSPQEGPVEKDQGLFAERLLEETWKTMGA
jgi:hypothetical protein